MTITESQRTTIMQLWGRVCKDRKWKTSDKTFRLAKFSELLGRKLESTNDVERINECTKLMNELKCLLGISIQAGKEATDPSLNAARVLRNQILTEIIPCLELYRGEKLTADLAGIMEDKNRWWKLDRPVRGMTLMDLDARPIFRTDRATGEQKFCGSQLSQMQWTLARWMNDLRNEAGDTIHQMKMKAGVPCTCAECLGRRVALSAGDHELEPLAGADPELGTEVCAGGFGDGKNPF